MRLLDPLRLAPVFALSAAACGGGLSGSTDRPSTLATVQGQIDNPSKLPLESTAFRVAIVWSIVDADSGLTKVKMAEDIPVTPVFPAQFQLALTEPPPSDAMNDGWNGAAIVAFGSIVAYEDLNNNGKLDLIDPNAPQAIDRVVAVPEDYTLVYIEGDVAKIPPKAADDNGAMPSVGFNLYQVQPLGEWACNGGPVIEGVTPPSCPGFLWKSMSTPLTLSLSADPTLSVFMCNGGTSGGVSGGGSGTPGNLNEFTMSGLPLKSDPHLSCAADGRSFTYSRCMPVAVKSLCDVELQCQQTRYLLPATTPTGWPCAVK
jgi:hypothetical protein